MGRIVAAIFALGLIACGPNHRAPGEVIQEAGPGDRYDDLGPQAVAYHKVWIPARYTDVIQTDVYYPSDAEGYLDRSKAPYPVIILIQEQYRNREQFRWLAEHLASWGLVVAAPKHPWENPAWNIDNAVWTLDGLLNLGQDGSSFLDGGLSETQAGLVRYYIAGQSTTQIDEDARFDTITLLGANMDPSSTFQSTSTLLFVMGANDCRESAVNYWESYNTLRHQVTVTGMSQSQWLESADEEIELSTPTPCPEGQNCTLQTCDPQISRTTAHRLTQGVVTAFELTYLRGESDSSALDTQLQSTVGLEDIQWAEPDTSESDTN